MGFVSNHFDIIYYFSNLYTIMADRVGVSTKLPVIYWFKWNQISAWVREWVRGKSIY